MVRFLIRSLNLLWLLWTCLNFTWIFNGLRYPVQAAFQMPQWVFISVKQNINIYFGTSLKYYLWRFRSRPSFRSSLIPSGSACLLVAVPRYYINTATNWPLSSLGSLPTAFPELSFPDPPMEFSSGLYLVKCQFCWGWSPFPNGCALL